MLGASDKCIEFSKFGNLITPKAKRWAGERRLSLQPHKQEDVQTQHMLKNKSPVWCHPPVILVLGAAAGVMETLGSPKLAGQPV